VDPKAARWIINPAGAPDTGLEAILRMPDRKHGKDQKDPWCK
jgi:hypothetical protein